MSPTGDATRLSRDFEERKNDRKTPEDKAVVCRLLFDRRDGTITLQSNELDTCNGEITVSRGRAVIWSGEYFHAGASYDVMNSRLFIAITLRKN